MIQRIQSIFILAAALLLGCLIVWPIDSFGGAQGLIELRWNGVWDVTPGAHTPLVRPLHSLAVVIVVAVILHVVSLFSFTHRQLQMRLVGISAGVSLCLTALLCYLGFQISGGLGMDMHINFHWALPIVAAILDILAYRRISDDDAIVKSLDRLR